MSENEQNNVTPIRPELESGQPNRRPHGNSLAIRIVLLAVALLLTILLVCFLMFRDQLSPARLKRNFIYSRNADAIVFSFDEGQNNAYTVFQDSLAAVTVSGFSVYDPMGELLGTAQHVYTAPLVMAGDRIVMACDIGGNRLTVLDANGLVVLDEESKGTLLDADISQDDSICTTALADGCKTVLSVYDSGLNRIYQWFSSSRYMNQAAVSDSAEYLCAAALQEKNGAFESAAVIFRTDAEEPVAEVSLGNQMILELQFLSNSVICAIGEKSMVCFGLQGEILGSYSYDGSYLKDYSISRDGFAVLSLNMYQAGSRYSLVTLDASGNMLAEQYIGEEILSLSAAGGYCGVLTPSRFSVYDEQLNLCASTAELSDASSAVILEDGSAILLGSGSGTLYLPN